LPAYTALGTNPDHYEWMNTLGLYTRIMGGTVVIQPILQVEQERFQWY